MYSQKMEERRNEIPFHEVFRFVRHQYVASRDVCAVAHILGQKPLICWLFRVLGYASIAGINMIGATLLDKRPSYHMV